MRVKEDGKGIRMERWWSEVCPKKKEKRQVKDIEM
jgi:hypothetical protein